MIDDAVRRRVMERAKGLCEICRLGAADTVREYLPGRWARWDFSTARWVDGRGNLVPTLEVHAKKDQLVVLRVVEAGAWMPGRFAGRILNLCQLCAQAATTAPVVENLELDL